MMLGGGIEHTASAEGLDRRPAVMVRPLPGMSASLRERTDPEPGPGLGLGVEACTIWLGVAFLL